MTLVSKFFSDGANYHADDINQFVRDALCNGVIDGLEVSESSTPAMSVSVGTGSGYVHGHGFDSDDTVLVSIPASESSPRIDRVIAKLNSSDVTIEVKQGTASASPVPPTLTENETSLAQVMVGAGVTAIYASDILNGDKTVAKHPQMRAHYSMHAAGDIDAIGIDESQIVTGKMNGNRIPTASASVLGAVKPDGGTTVVIDGNMSPVYDTIKIPDYTSGNVVLGSVSASTPTQSKTVTTANTTFTPSFSRSVSKLKKITCNGLDSPTIPVTAKVTAIPSVHEYMNSVNVTITGYDDTTGTTIGTIQGGASDNNLPYTIGSLNCNTSHAIRLVARVNYTGSVVLRDVDNCTVQISGNVSKTYYL